CFVVFLIFITLISGIIQESFLIGTVSSRLFRFVFYIACIILISQKFFDLKYGMKIYRWLVISATIFLIVQFILYNLSGIILQGTIPNAQMINDFSYDKIENSLNRFFRPMSFFTEPGYYARYVLPF